MDNLRDILEQKYFTNGDEKYSMEQIANDVINLLNTDKSNYFDVTGFAKDFYLSSSLTQGEKKHFYNELKAKNFFQSLNTFLYSDDFAVCSWTIYTIGKFSNNENAGYLEAAYETSFGLTNPILSYRCLSELDWLSSEKVEQYLASLKEDNSIISKLTLLYYWEIKSYSSEFKDLLTDKELIAFVVPNQTLVDTEDEICDRLFSFENHIFELYTSNKKSFIDNNEFESVAEAYFKNYSKPVDEQADKDHQDFLKQLNCDQ